MCCAVQIEAGGRLDEAQRHRLEMIHLAGAQLRSLIDDVLDVSQTEFGRLAINLETMNLGALIDEVLELNGPNAEAQSICLETAGPIRRSPSAATRCACARCCSIFCRTASSTTGPAVMCALPPGP